MAAERQPHVLIVGAGLGGLALAQALRKQGISFEIFEKSSNDTLQGWSIGLHSVIDDLLAAFPSDMPPLETVNHLLPLSLPAQILFYHDNSIENRTGVQDLGDKSIIRANRQRLRNWLATNLRIQFNKAANTIDEGPDRVIVHFKDGTSVTGDVVIGADGVHSSIRQHLLSALDRPDPLQKLPIAIAVGEVTLRGSDFERQLELGYSSYMAWDHDAGPHSGILFVGLNSVSAEGTQGRYFWFLMHADEEASQEAHWMSSASKEELLTHTVEKTAHLDIRFREIVGKTDPEGMVTPPAVFRDLELDHLPVGLGRVTLLGDAAHCMAPLRGEGGAHAIRDALNLACVLTKIAEDGGDVAIRMRLFDEYQREMLERGAEAVRLSRSAFALQPTDKERPTSSRMAWGKTTVQIPYKEIHLKDISVAS